MDTNNNTNEKTTIPLFKYVIKGFSVGEAIFREHQIFLHNQMMCELATKIRLSHESSAPYYPQVNGKVQEIKEFLKEMLQCMLGVHK